MLIETDFAASALGSLDSDPNWEAGAGSATNLSLVSFGSGKAVASAGGTNRYLRQNDDPATVHQRVEISFTFSTIGADAYSGVVSRHIDANNYILARVIHDRSSLTASIVERIAGIMRTQHVPNEFWNLSEARKKAAATPSSPQPVPAGAR
jgi:hypothetical protein